MVKYDNIPGFPGYYISKRGGLWSNHKNGQWKKLKPHLNKMWNRYQCTLRDSRGIRKLCKISRLVATVYLPNSENLPIVMHLDNNPANDYYRNLKWGTQKENIKQCLSDGRLFKNEVFLSHQQKPDTIRDSVVKDYIKGFPLKYISNKYQVSISDLKGT